MALLQVLVFLVLVGLVLVSPPPVPEIPPAKLSVLARLPVVNVFDPNSTEEVLELPFNEPIV